MIKNKSPQLYELQESFCYSDVTLEQKNNLVTVEDTRLSMKGLVARTGFEPRGKSVMGAAFQRVYFFRLPKSDHAKSLHNRLNLQELSE